MNRTDVRTPQKCAFIFAHYDDSALDAALMLKAAPPGSVAMVLCSGVPTGPMNRLRQHPVLSAIRRTHPVTTIVHAFGRPVYGEWDEQCGFSVSTQEAMAVRVAEHERVCRMFDLDTHGLGVLDGQYSHRGSASFEAAVDEATRLVRERRLEMVVTHPLSAAHPDHQKAHRVARAVCDATGAELITVCERPYTVCRVDDCAYTKETGDEKVSTQHLDDDTWRLKYAAVSEYTTQINALSISFEFDWMDREYLGVECYHSVRSLRRAEPAR